MGATRPWHVSGSPSEFLIRDCLDPATTQNVFADELGEILVAVADLDLIAGVTDLATPRPAARWFLLPQPLSGGTPDLDGTPMPFGADGWLELSLDVAPVAEPAESAALASPTSTIPRKAPVK